MLATSRVCLLLAGCAAAAPSFALDPEAAFGLASFHDAAFTEDAGHFVVAHGRDLSVVRTNSLGVVGYRFLDQALDELRLPVVGNDLHAARENEVYVSLLPGLTGWQQFDRNSASYSASSPSNMDLFFAELQTTETDIERIKFDVVDSDTFSVPTRTAALVTSRDRTRIAVLVDGIISDEVRVYTLPNATGEVRLQDLPSGVRSIQFTPDGTGILVLPDGENTALLWSISSRRVSKTIVGHGGEVLSADFSADGTKLLTGSKDNNAILWNMSSQTPNIERQFFGTSDVKRVGLVSGVQQAWTLETNGALTLWDYNTTTTTTTARLTVRTTTDGLKGFGVSADGGVVAMASGPSNDQFRVSSYNGVTNEQFFSVAVPGTSLKALEVSPDGSKVLISVGTITQEYDARTGAPGRVVSDNKVATDATYSPDGRSIALITDDRVFVYTFSESDDPLEYVGVPEDDGLRTVAFSPDSSRLAAGGTAGVAYVWRLGTAGGVQTLTPVNLSPDVTALAFPPNNASLFVGRTNGEVLQFDLSNGAQAFAYNPFEAGTFDSEDVLTLAVSPAGTRLLIGSAINRVALFDLATNRRVNQITSLDVRRAAFARGAEQLLVASSEGPVYRFGTVALLSETLNNRVLRGQPVNPLDYNGDGIYDAADYVVLARN